MNSSFQSNLRTKSSEQLLNMVTSKNSWSTEQLKMIIAEIENRDLINDEVEELKANLYGSVEEEIDLDDPKNQFEEDLSIIYKEEERIQKREKFRIPALVLLVFVAGIYFAVLFDIPGATGFNNQYSEDLVFVFYEFKYLFVLMFFGTVGLFVGKLYLFSLIASAINLITLGALVLGLSV